MTPWRPRQWADLARRHALHRDRRSERTARVQVVVDSAAKDIVYVVVHRGTRQLSRGSIVNAGLDPDDLPTADKNTMDFGSGGSAKAKAWRTSGAPGRASARCTTSFRRRLVDRMEPTTSLHAIASRAPDGRP